MTESSQNGPSQTFISAQAIALEKKDQDPLPPPPIKKSGWTGKELKACAAGVAFLLPNILGFLAFTAIPLVVSLVYAFTNRNLELHNAFRHEEIQFVGFDNFIRLFKEPDFLRYLSNTFYMMLGIPFGMAGSLVAALLLNKNFKGGNNRIWLFAIVGCLIIASSIFLTLIGMGASAMFFLIMGLLGVILIIGSTAGQTIYRTLFYLPNFTAGVATYILWKKMYSPQTGPINNALQPALTNIAHTIERTSSSLWPVIGIIFALIGIILIVWRLVAGIRHWQEGESGTVSVILGSIFILTPLVWTGLYWPNWAGAGLEESIGVNIRLVLAAVGALSVIIVLNLGRQWKSVWDYGLSNAVILGAVIMGAGFFFFGLSGPVYHLFETVVVNFKEAGAGLEAPAWTADYAWAKPALIFMGLWAAFGSNNMLLYLAGLSGVSPELYEAADIDGANSWQRFWNVTWPQLANVTFFIFVMSVIGGLQGGFEMAKAMTNGGPAGSTTTISYYIYTEGFATGRLGYASAVSWTLFAMVLAVTLFNWKFGNKYTNE